MRTPANYQPGVVIPGNKDKWTFNIEECLRHEYSDTEYDTPAQAKQAMRKLVDYRRKEANKAAATSAPAPKLIPIDKLCELFHNFHSDVRHALSNNKLMSKEQRDAFFDARNKLYLACKDIGIADKIDWTDTNG